MDIVGIVGTLVVGVLFVVLFLHFYADSTENNVQEVTVTSHAGVPNSNDETSNVWRFRDLSLTIKILKNATPTPSVLAVRSVSGFHKIAVEEAWLACTGKSENGVAIFTLNINRVILDKLGLTMVDEASLFFTLGKINELEEEDFSESIKGVKVNVHPSQQQGAITFEDAATRQSLQKKHDKIASQEGKLSLEEQNLQHDLNLAISGFKQADGSTITLDGQVRVSIAFPRGAMDDFRVLLLPAGNNGLAQYEHCTQLFEIEEAANKIGTRACVSPTVIKALQQLNQNPNDGVLVIENSELNQTFGDVEGSTINVCFSLDEVLARMLDQIMHESRHTKFLEILQNMEFRVCLLTMSKSQTNETVPLAAYFSAKTCRVHVPFPSLCPIFDMRDEDRNNRDQLNSIGNHNISTITHAIVGTTLRFTQLKSSLDSVSFTESNDGLCWALCRDRNDGSFELVRKVTWSSKRVIADDITHRIDFSGPWTVTAPGTYRMRLIKQRQRQGPIPLLNGPPVALDPLPLPIAISGDVCNNTNKTLDHAFVKASFGQPIKVVQHDIPSNAIDAAHASLSMYRISAETNMTVTKKDDLGDWIKNELSQEVFKKRCVDLCDAWKNRGLIKSTSTGGFSVPRSGLHVEKASPKMSIKDGEHAIDTSANCNQSACEVESTLPCSSSKDARLNSVMARTLTFSPRSLSPGWYVCALQFEVDNEDTAENVSRNTGVSRDNASEQISDANMDRVCDHLNFIPPIRSAIT
jgi:hypothetical protein